MKAEFVEGNDYHIRSALCKYMYLNCTELAVLPVPACIFKQVQTKDRSRREKTISLQKGKGSMSVSYLPIHIQYLFKIS